MSALEIAQSGASDRKVGVSRNLGRALADFYGHYSSRDLQVTAFNSALDFSGTMSPNEPGPGLMCIMARTYQMIGLQRTGVPKNRP